jgi:hypothetical protein
VEQARSQQKNQQHVVQLVEHLASKKND